METIGVRHETQYAAGAPDGPFDLHDLDNLARAADIYNMSMQLKVDQEPRSFLAQRAIGSGFHSILFADCRSAADVQECVRIVRAETPEDGGTYGVATRRFTYMGYGGTKEYVQALRDIVVAIMIEKPGTVDTLEEVLSVKGVDMVQWGGSDYSMGIGRAGERYSPQLRVVERRVFEPPFLRRHRHHDPAPVVEIPGGGPAQGSRPLICFLATHLRA